MISSIGPKSSGRVSLAIGRHAISACHRIITIYPRDDDSHAEVYHAQLVCVCHLLYFEVMHKFGAAQLYVLQSCTVKVGADELAHANSGEYPGFRGQSHRMDSDSPPGEPIHATNKAFNMPYVVVDPLHPEVCDDRIKCECMNGC